MSNVKNLNLKKIKESLAMVSAGVITLASTGCGFEGKKNDDVANSPIGYIDEQTLPANETTLSTASSSVETTTTLKPFDKNSGRIKHFDDGTSVVSDYVETSYEDELTTTGTTYTTVKGTNVVTEKKNEDTTKTSKSTTVKPITTTVKITKTSANTTKTTVDTAKTTNTTKTTKPTTKATTSTTKATTPKPTTTVTTTTTEAVTEPPVQQDYNINDICYSADAFRYFGDSLVNELKTDSNGTYYNLVGFKGVYTDLRVEGYYLLALLNYGAVNDDVICDVFNEFDKSKINSCIDFMDCLGSHSLNLNKKIDFEKISCDSCKYVGQYANIVEDNYCDNNIENFIAYEIDDGNIDQKYLDSLAIKVFLNAYGSDYLWDPKFEDASYEFEDYLYRGKTLSK